MKVVLTERARDYITTRAEKLMEMKEKPVLAIWAERIYS